MEGDLFTDEISLLAYSTDASVYREIPLAVTRPRNPNDVKKLIQFARENKTSIIPRTAGTSLAGQVVGNGIIVDVSKYMTEILEINVENHFIRLQPGVVLDELNKKLAIHGLFFGPETSTSTRCMIGGMVGNNSCGSHSLIYGSTRDHLLEAKCILSDGSDIEFKNIDKEEFINICEGEKLENKIYQNIQNSLSKIDVQNEIRAQYPDKEIERRNTGYAIDLLIETQPFSENNEPFNFCKLIAGSEGTLAFITEIKLNLVPLPPKEKAVICVHFKTLEEALQANILALNFKPDAIELIDDILLDCTKDNITQFKNRDFVKGNPAAILIIEFAKDSVEEIKSIAAILEKELTKNSFGYYFPILFNDEINKVWSLRKAGLGLMANYPGSRKPLTVVEDTAVNPKVLPEYIAEFKLILKKYHLECAFNGHIATGELHIKPILNLKDPEDLKLFRILATEIAKLVKKYKGSLSGEHGDGRLRGEFIPFMIGEKNYQLIKEIKSVWDPDSIFNPGKIIETPLMDSSLRFDSSKEIKPIKTHFDFSRNMGIYGAAEQCNGSADCRKSEIIGGLMCPSYMATKNENSTTRARANILREFLANSTKENPFNHKEIYEVMDLCLSCKGCKSECPSNVDITKLKAEFLQHYYDANGIQLRTRIIANLPKLNQFASNFTSIFNFFQSNHTISNLLMKSLGFSTKRRFLKIHKFTLRNWAKKNLAPLNPTANLKGKILFFIDEFTNFNDVEVGIKAINSLTILGYQVEIAPIKISARTYLSKGFLKKSKRIINGNLASLKELVKEDLPLIGIEPSCILSMRDEYLSLASKENLKFAEELAKNSFIIDEFLEKEILNGRIIKEQFTKERIKIKLHGHCHQKAISSVKPSIIMLTIPENYEVEEIKSGCCGMGGAFGYEKEHYEVSMAVGELVLFPEVRKADNEFIIATPGTICRQQIKDGTGKTAFHPIELFYNALLK
ncbi:MAG: FAD-binding protein [Bacteroidetes bacterium]|nr:FAD-binding protein [Bacteroidota bacterium]